MRRYEYSTTSDLRPEALFRAISAIERWPEWDRELEWTIPPHALSEGNAFSLKPKGGPKVAMRIVGLQPPTSFADSAKLPLATMRTEHSFEHDGRCTHVCIGIEVAGPLAWLWDRLLVRKQAKGVEAQTAAFLAFARDGERHTRVEATAPGVRQGRVA